MAHLHSHKKGFTILELLVVMALVSIVLSIIIVSTTGLKTKARDTTRLSHMNEIVTALNLYYTNHGRFPIATSEITITSDDIMSVELEGDEVIQQTPTDPSHPTFTYRYISDSLGLDYILTFCLETDTIQGYNKGCENALRP